MTSARSGSCPRRSAAATAIGSSVGRAAAGSGIRQIGIRQQIGSGRRTSYCLLPNAYCPLPPCMRSITSNPCSVRSNVQPMRRGRRAASRGSWAIISPPPVPQAKPDSDVRRLKPQAPGPGLSASSPILRRCSSATSTISSAASTPCPATTMEACAKGCRPAGCSSRMCRCRRRGGRAARQRGERRGAAGIASCLFRAELPLPDRRLSHPRLGAALRYAGRGAVLGHRQCDAPTAPAANRRLAKGARPAPGAAARRACGTGRSCGSSSKPFRGSVHRASTSRPPISKKRGSISSPIAT